MTELPPAVKGDFPFPIVEPGRNHLTRVLGVPLAEHTVALEALIVGRPVIALNPFYPSPEPSIYEAAGCVLAVNRLEELGTALDSLLANEASVRKIRESAALAINEWLSHRGAAGKRVAEIIALLREQSVVRRRP